ncbi:putative nuclease HARBI1 [Phlebotomus argentipes]|uniref:putative nuclease HARBI1 n=1 Tax=Phlebotomus argentipes TaxID=94469 RepID=UPI00289357CD|nr:putative nuclease HARBI1 [Phlebotomus argentipes]
MSVILLALLLERKIRRRRETRHICDADLRILNLNASSGGSERDNLIFYASDVNSALREKYAEGERNNWLLASDAYHHFPWLMTPVTNPQSVPENSYNRAHRKCQLDAVKCIGVVKSRFRCLSRQRSKQKTLMYSPEATGKLIKACCVLHNVMIQHDYVLPSEEEVTEELESLPERTENNARAIKVEESDEDAEERTLVQAGRSIRSQIIVTNF